MMDLLLNPVNAYTNVLDILKLPHYQEFLELQSWKNQRTISQKITRKIIYSEVYFDNLEILNLVFAIIKPLVKSTKFNYGGSSPVLYESSSNSKEGLQQDDKLLALLVYRIYNDENKELELEEKLEVILFYFIL